MGLALSIAGALVGIWLCHSLAARPWDSPLSPLCLRSPLCKMRTGTTPTSWDQRRPLHVTCECAGGWPSLLRPSSGVSGTPTGSAVHPYRQVLHLQGKAAPWHCSQGSAVLTLLGSQGPRLCLLVRLQFCLTAAQLFIFFAPMWYYLSHTTQLWTTGLQGWPIFTLFLPEPTSSGQTPLLTSPQDLGPNPSGNPLSQHRPGQRVI